MLQGEPAFTQERFVANFVPVAHDNYRNLQRSEACQSPTLVGDRPVFVAKVAPAPGRQEPPGDRQVRSRVALVDVAPIDDASRRVFIIDEQMPGVEIAMHQRSGVELQKPGSASSTIACHEARDRKSGSGLAEPFEARLSPRNSPAQIETP